jgi:hypothetical protein
MVTTPYVEMLRGFAHRFAKRTYHYNIFRAKGKEGAVATFVFVTFSKLLQIKG